ncbi:hypothetical protein TNCV_1920661 [Trichonephila clavipes]|nr:hypothetical protein TNCV_1920661 [Trichonephila clavipes]
MPKTKVLTTYSPLRSLSVTYEIARPGQPLGTYYVSACKGLSGTWKQKENTGFVAPLREKRTPKKRSIYLWFRSRDVNGTRGESVTHGLILRPKCRWLYLQRKCYRTKHCITVRES